MPVDVKQATGPKLTDQGDATLATAFGNLKVSDLGGTQYFGPSHWESIIDDIAEMKTYFETSPESYESVDDLRAVASSIKPVDVFFSISRTYSRDEILCHLPVKADLDRWLAAWFTTPDSLRFVVHAPTFQQEYIHFWQDQQAVSTIWLALLLALASLGAEISAQTRRSPSMLVQAEDLRRLAVHAIVLSDYTRPQPYLVETLLLYMKALMIRCHSTDNQIWIMLGLVTRLSTLAGYQHDPSVNPAISAFSGEMRRRVWSAIREYDIIMCYSFGAVSVINHQGGDTRPPSNLSESEFSPSCSLLPSSKPLTELTSMTFGICYSKLTYIYGDAVYCSQVLTDPSLAEIESLDTRLRRAYDELPQSLRLLSMDQCFLDSPERILDRFRLALLYTKALCVLYRRYLGVAGCETQHECCLSAAEQHAKYHETLMEATQSGGQLEYCSVAIARHVHDFTLAALILCSELKRRSVSGRTPRSNEWSERITKSLERGCVLWQSFVITSPKLRVAVSAILKFLQEQNVSSTNAVSDADASQKINRTVAASHTLEPLMFSTEDNMPAAQPVPNWAFPMNEVPDHATAHTEGFDFGSPDTFLQGLFSSGYNCRDDHSMQWP